MARDAEQESQALYRRLGVSPSDSREQIHAAYRRMSLSSHPDTCQGDPEAAERFRRLTEAYEVLGDVRRRAIYDREEARALLNETKPPARSDVEIRMKRLAEHEDAPLWAGPVRIVPAGAPMPVTGLPQQQFLEMPWSVVQLLEHWWQR
jgi:hypothetical protein